MSMTVATSRTCVLCPASLSHSKAAYGTRVVCLHLVALNRMLAAACTDNRVADCLTPSERLSQQIRLESLSHGSHEVILVNAQPQ